MALELWAPDEPALLIEGARAVVEVMTDGASVKPIAIQRVELDSVDAEDRLVQWLNEIIWLAVGQGFLFADAEIALRPDGLTATLRGQDGARGRLTTELKSATYHDLHLGRSPDGLYRARIVIDV